MTINDTADFTALVTGTNKLGIKSWKVCNGAGKNCINGGSSTMGMIVEIGTDGEGNHIARYTSPANVPAAPFCTPVTGGCRVIVKALKKVGTKKKTATAAVTITPHSVSLVWDVSPSGGVVAYNVYRGSVSGGPYARIASFLGALAYKDITVQSGQTYYYVVTAVDVNEVESTFSSEAQAVVPP